MSKYGRIFLTFCVSAYLITVASPTTAEAPQIILSKQGNSQVLTASQIEKEIELMCDKYDFNYPTLMKWLAMKESKLGQDKRQGDGGQAFGLYQWHKKTWQEFQDKLNRHDLDINSNTDQIEMTIIALKKGYWYLWGPLKRRFNGNPFTS